MISDEQRAYSKGYYAGRRKVKQQRTVENVRRERQAFLDKAFLALLPTAMTQDTWTIGGKPANTLEDRVRLAASWAKEALLKRPIV